MNTNHSKFILMAVLASAATLQAANVTTYDSIISLVTNLTKNYTFTDPASGQSVVVSVTISPYSPTTNSSTFQVIDSNTHVGVNYGNGMKAGMGANFSASLVSMSSNVIASSVTFGIAGLGIRPADGGGEIAWQSSSSSFDLTYNTGTEVIETMDTTNFSLFDSTYVAHLRFPGDGLFQLTDVPAPGQSVVLSATFSVTNTVDPRTNSWLTTYAGRYARIYTTDANKNSGNSSTTWSTGSTAQATPAYCGVQEIYSSSNWVYIRSTGLGSHVMGPWYLDANHNTLFPNYPTNEHVLYKIPRVPVVLSAKARNNGGAIGYFVDGVAMFNSWDAYYYTNSTEVQGGGNGGYWNRDAYVNEGASFDANNAHQAGGQHHYHANPPALRYLLGDHVNYNSTSKTYPEATNAPKHSPILGWAADGFPIYGPYGYSVSNDASSSVRRMISGYVLRNGQHGSQNLTNLNRVYLPQWAVRLYGVSSNVMAGPNVSSSYPVGRYMEDNDYLGDLGVAAGTNTYDLDEYNGRWCVTPEFPNPPGTYAYFVSISSNGTPVFPYNIGRGFYGSPTGAAVGSIPELVTTNFLGGSNLPAVLNPPVARNGAVSLTWSALEGGTYSVQTTTDMLGWTTSASGIAAVQNTGVNTNNSTDNHRFYRVARTSLANFDSPGSGGGSLVYNTVAPGGGAARGTTVQVLITLPSTPPNPPAGAPISSVTLAGSIAGTGITDTTAGTVTATFNIPSNASTGLQNVVVVFTSGPTYTVSGVTIN